MPQPDEPIQPQPSAEDSFLDLLSETLDSLDPHPRAQFLQRFFKTISQIDLTETQSQDCWDQILRRRQELTTAVGKRISLKTAMLDVLASINFLRVPILVEYEDYKKLQINAATDALTGLYNRRLFEEYWEKELNRAKRYGQHLALVILDLHRFKEVNDRHGHVQGDTALQMAAATLRKTLRASDSAFRIGGDEFALLLPQADPEQANTLCSRVRAFYESELRPLNLNVPLAIDFGVAVYPEDGDEKGTLIQLADERLYQHKKASQAPPPVAPPEPPPRPHAAPFRAGASVSVPSAPPSAPPRIAPEPVPAPSTPPRTEERRKWERVSLAGTRAYALVGEGGQRTAAVIDLSYGGVALSVERPEEFASTFYAVLHVPILPPVRVSLRKIYALKNDGRWRIGCAFVS
jgi:diguanylate cyclase (GGDEF)-like protein